MPYMNNLCCGVHVANLPPELYQRWIQLSAFHPIFWFHGIWGLRLPWEYGDAGMETYRKFVGLRYALLPYTYTCSRIAHDTGLPLVRGMYLDYPDQEQAFASNQQYLFGRELLVAPVTKPGGGKPVNTDVFLPAGDDWFDYFTGDIYQGGRKIVHRCPLDRMPLFARAGSIIPTGPKMDYSDQKPVDPLTLDVYAGKRPAEFKLYEDDGVSLDYRKGAHAWTTIAFKPAGAAGNYALTIGPADGRFAGQLDQRHYLVRVHGLLKPKAVDVDQTKLAEIGDDPCGAGWTWDPKARTTTIRLPNAYAIDQPVAVALRQAGTFADALVLQKARNLRNQIREAKRLMKVKNAELVGTRVGDQETAARHFENGGSGAGIDGRRRASAGHRRQSARFPGDAATGARRADRQALRFDADDSRPRTPLHSRDQANRERHVYAAGDRGNREPPSRRRCACVVAPVGIDTACLQPVMMPPASPPYSRPRKIAETMRKVAEAGLATIR